MNNQEAIELLKPLTEFEGNEDFVRKAPMVSDSATVEALKMAIKALEERRCGLWVASETKYPYPFKCSVCDHKNAYKPNYCSYCGASMGVNYDN